MEKVMDFRLIIIVIIFCVIESHCRETEM